MFDMFRGGKIDPITLMAVDYEEHKKELDRIVRFIKKHYTGSGVIDVDDLSKEMGIDIDLTDADIRYIEKRVCK